MSDLDKALKALTITDETILFVDIEQISLDLIQDREEFPKGMLIVGVMGEPNVLAMTRQELQEILDQKDTLLLPRSGKAQERDYRVILEENLAIGKAMTELWPGKLTAPVREPFPDLEGEPEEGCLMYGGGEGGMCSESRNCPGCAQIRRLRAKQNSPAASKFPEWSEARLRELAEQEPDCGVWACSPEIFAEMCADAEKENLSEVRKEETPDAVGETVLPEVREEQDAEVAAPESVVLVDERMKAAETQLVTEIVENYGKVLRDEFEGKPGGK